MAVITPELEPPDSALCLGCNYSLRKLTVTRCPECGRPFDPGDPWTMNIGRPMPPLVWRLIQPPGKLCWFFFFASVLGILWGSAWLPGGQLIELPALLFLLLNVLYRGIRFPIAVALAQRYRQPRPPRGGLLGRPYASALILIALGAALAADLPFGATYALMKPRLYRMWAVDPSPRGWIHNELVGPFWVEFGEVNPNGVYLNVKWSGALQARIDPNDNEALVFKSARYPFPQAAQEMLGHYWWKLRHWRR